jgi:hypothetical protein
MTVMAGLMPKAVQAPRSNGSNKDALEQVKHDTYV